MLITVQDAKGKFRFRFANFCIMPTHMHLLIEPDERTNLSMIMRLIKTQSAKRWNSIHGSKDHMWGAGYYERAVKNPHEFEFVMDYIDQTRQRWDLPQFRQTGKRHRTTIPVPDPYYLVVCNI